MALPAHSVTEQYKAQKSTSQDIPDYLKETYYWAYINPRNVHVLNRDFVARAILWGNYNKLMREAFREIKPGAHVLQSSYVYGSFLEEFAKHIGENGKLDVIDVVPLQVENCNRRLRNFPYANGRLADAENPGSEVYDVVCSYFLLHEVPYQKKGRIINNLLKRVSPGGKMVFMDYHKPSNLNPLKYPMYLVWHLLEPYAFDLIESEIQAFVQEDMKDRFEWRKEIYFGGLYQKVVATRI